MLADSRSKWRTVIRTAVVVGAFVAASVSTRAQTGALEVAVVAAADHAPLAGATVVLSNDKSLIADTTVISDADGMARFPVLRGGTGYVITVSMPGFGKQRIADVRVRSSETARMAFVLLPLQQEQVEVTARSDVVDLNATSGTTRFSDQFVEALPVPGRFYQNVLTLAPGVNDADEDGNPNVHGARQRDFRAEVGGVSNVDPLTGQWLSFVHPASIEEIEVITTGAGVEFGRAQGGFARITQTQGSNELQGALGYIFRSSALDGSGAAEVRSAFVPRFQWSQPSIELSGPIVRNRLWFRLAHEWIHGEDPQNLLGVVEVMPRDQQTAADQLTWQVSPRNKLAFQYQSSDLTLGNYGITSTVPVESSYTLRRSGPTYSVSWLVPYSAHLLIDSLVSWQDHSFELTPTKTDATQDCVRFYFFKTLETARCFNSASGLTSGSFPESSHDDRQRFTVRSNFTWFKERFLGTSHRLQFGFSIEDERFHRELERNPDLDSLMQRELTKPCWLGGPDACYGTIKYTTALISVPGTSSATANGSNWGVYLEDQLRPSTNLSITLGLRMDREEIDAEGETPIDPAAEAAAFLAGYSPGNTNANVALAARVFTAYPGVQDFQQAVADQLGVDPDLIPLSTLSQTTLFWQNQQRHENIAIRNNNFSPRLSLAWDPASNGKSKLALSAGRYYDKIVLAVPLVELEPASTTLLFRTPPTPYLGAPPPVNERYRAYYPLSGVAPTVRTQMVDRDLRTPYQDELALSFETEISTETLLKATLIRRSFRDQMQDVDINHAVGDRGFCVSASSINAPVVQPSPGTGAELVDVQTGEHYVDTDPGSGDGRIDDCTGVVKDVAVNEDVFPPAVVRKVLPDGLADLYVLNPGWGEVLLVGNFNSAEYTGFVLELIRRMYRNWEMQASYTWSKAEGDAEDFNQDLGNERNLREDERGYLSYDQRHVLRFNAVGALGAGFRMGGVVRWQSGLPYSELQSVLTLFSVPPEYTNVGSNDVKYRLRYPTQQRNDQRNPSYWNLDLMLAKEFALGRSTHLQLTAEVFNVMGDDTVVLGDRIDGTNSGVQRFGRRYQLGAQLTF